MNNEENEISKKDQYSIFAVTSLMLLVIFLLVIYFTNSFPNFSKNLNNEQSTADISTPNYENSIKYEKKNESQRPKETITLSDNEVIAADKNQEKNNPKKDEIKNMEINISSQDDSSSKYKNKVVSKSPVNQEVKSEALENNYNSNLFFQKTEKDGSKTWTNSKFVEKNAKIYGGAPTKEIREIKLADGSTAYTNLSMPFLE